MVRSSSCEATPRPADSAPCGSRSTSSTRRPYSASAAPRLIVDVVLPTPPFWLHTAITVAGPWLVSGRGVGMVRQGRPVGPRSASETGPGRAGGLSAGAVIGGGEPSGSEPSGSESGEPASVADSAASVDRGATVQSAEQAEPRASRGGRAIVLRRSRRAEIRPSGPPPTAARGHEEHRPRRSRPRRPVRSSVPQLPHVPVAVAIGDDPAPDTSRRPCSAYAGPTAATNATRPTCVDDPPPGDSPAFAPRHVERTGFRA